MSDTTEKPVFINAHDLLAKSFPDVHWFVNGLIAEGLTILAGRPKTGKSWLALHLALAMSQRDTALGKFQTSFSDVIYLCLEDGERRLQRRLSKLCNYQSEVNNLPFPPIFATTWPRLGERGLELLEEAIVRHSKPNGKVCVFIDTLAMVRDSRKPNEDLYKGDYDAIGQIRKLAHKCDAGIVVLTHTRKPSHGGDEVDFLDSVTGSSGLTGAADAVLVLDHPRHSNEGKLHVTGRDAQEAAIPLIWNKDTCTWSCADDTQGRDPDRGLSSLQRQIRQLLRKSAIPMKPLAIAHEIGKDHETIKKVLQRMFNDRILEKPCRGHYLCPNDNSSPSSP